MVLKPKKNGLLIRMSDKRTNTAPKACQIMELGIFILLIWYLSLFVSKHLELLQSFSSTGSKIPTFLESQIINFRIIIIDCLNNDRKCTFISIYQRLPQIQCHLLFFMLLFAFLCFLFACLLVIVLLLSNLFKAYRKNLGKARYQTFNILLFLAITTEAVVFTSSNQKSVILRNCVTFYFFKILYFFGDVSFPYWNDVILLVHIYISINFSFTCIKV